MISTSYLQIIVAIGVFLFAYRYTIRMNLRSSVSEIPPLKTESYVITPVVNSVRWRPHLPYIERLYPKMLKIPIISWFVPRSSIKFVIHEHDSDTQQPMEVADEIHQALQTPVGDSLDKVSGENLQDRFSDRLGDDYGFPQLQPLQLHKSSINLSCLSNKPDKVQNMARGFLHYCSWRLDEYSSKSEKQ